MYLVQPGLTDIIPATAVEDDSECMLCEINHVNFYKLEVAIICQQCARKRGLIW
jgi:hypothetical protein